MNVDTVELVDWLRKQRWSDYARKLIAHYEKNLMLTDAQIDTAVRMRENLRRGQQEPVR